MEEQNNNILDKARNYVIEHRKNVMRAFNLLKPNLMSFFELDKSDLDTVSRHIEEHDLSKFEPEELIPYANFFWGTKDDKVVEEFKIAVKLHKSRNLHHPEYWMNAKGESYNMPLIYVIEMICDWWSFGLMQNTPAEIFDFYETNKAKYQFPDTITAIVEKLLTIIRQSINEYNNTQFKETNEQ